MLNEAWQLLQALQRLQIHADIGSWHPLIHPLPISEKNLLRIRLDTQGDVASVEDVAREERVGMWRIIKTSDGSFPVLKVNVPLLDLHGFTELSDKVGHVRKDSDLINLVTEAVRLGTPRNWEDAGFQWNGSNSSLDKAGRLITTRAGGDRLPYSLRSLAVRYKKALRSCNGNKLLQEIVRISSSRLQTGQLAAIKTLAELIVGKGEDEEGTPQKISVLLALDLEDGSVYTKDTRNVLAQMLPTDLSSRKRVHQHRAVNSGFGGNGNLLNEPFPQVYLPVLNSYFPLVSMASDDDKAKCQVRYGLTEYTVFPVTSEQARQIGGALNWLVTREEGTTWRGVSSGMFEKNERTGKKKEKKDLLVVYLEEKPEPDIKLASLFGTGDEIALDQFEIDAKAVTKSLDGLVRERPRSKLNLFLIRDASDGQIHVALAESLHVKMVLQAAERWQQAVKQNVPQLGLYLQKDTRNGKELPEVKDASPLAPSPSQVVRLLSYQWMRDGALLKDGKPQKAKQEIIAPGLGEVLSLMLRTEGKWELARRNILNLLVRRVAPLLVGLFGAKHSFGPRKSGGKHEPYYDYPRESRETALQAVAVFGILLNSFNISKEKYMNETSYRIGQILSLADTLHKDYCVVVRKGQLPNSLIGTSLMRRALDDPPSALADLSERILEYIRWAKVAEVSNEWREDDPKKIAVNEARKKLRQYQFLSDKIDASQLPRECDDMMKAQLLLGFLASQPDEETENVDRKTKEIDK